MHISTTYLFFWVCKIVFNKFKDNPKSINYSNKNSFFFFFYNEKLNNNNNKKKNSI